MGFPHEEDEPENFLPKKSGAEKYIELLLDEKDKRIQEKQERIDNLQNRMEKTDNQEDTISALKRQIDNLRQKLRQKEQKIQNLEMSPTLDEYQDEIEELIIKTKNLEREIENWKEKDEDNLNKIKELSEENRKLKQKLEAEQKDQKWKTIEDEENEELSIENFRSPDLLMNEEAANAVDKFWEVKSGKFETMDVVEEIHGERMGTDDGRYNRIRSRLNQLAEQGEIYKKDEPHVNTYSDKDVFDQEENQEEKDSEEEEENRDYGKSELIQEIPDVLEESEPMSIVEIGKVFFGEDFTSRNVEYDRIYGALEDLKKKGTVIKLKRNNINKFKLANDKDVSNFQRSKVQEKMVEELEENKILYSAKDLMEKIFDNKWISASKTEKQKIYNAVSIEDRIKSVKIQEKGQTVTKYQLEGFDFEEQKTRENYSKMIDGQPLYEHIKVAMGKVLPGKGDSDVVSYEDFTKNLALENSDQDFEVWQSLYTDNDLIATIKKDLEVDFEVKFTKKSSGTAVTAKHYQMEIYR